MNDAPVLLMSPAKVLTRLGADRLHQSVPRGSAVITSGPTPADPAHLAHLEQVDDYVHNDLIPLLADSLIRKHQLTRVVVLAEADVLRGAELRHRHDLPGPKLPDVLPYRDKVLMKYLAEQSGVPVAKRRIATSALQLADAIDELGLSCVVKPPERRGSAGVQLMTTKSDLANFLRTGPFSDHGRTQHYLVEAFQEGEQYRVDGVCRNGEFDVLSVAVYVNSHLEYLSGGHLGSIILPEDSDKAQQMIALAQRVLFMALPQFDGGFHLEAFSTPNGPVFSEVGARLGGGSIPAEVELAYGVDIVEASILAQRGAALSQRPTQCGLAGQLHVSPQVGRLVQAPTTFNHDKVVLEEIAPVGEKFSAMTHTNAEFARCVFRADSLIDGLSTIESILTTLEAECRWVNS